MYVIIPIDEEIFKELTYPEIESGRYMISNYGTIYDNKFDKIKKNTFHKRTGYVVAKMKLKDGSRKMRMVHRLVAWEFCEGYNEEKTIVNHKDSDTENLYYENLEWCTISENNKHRFQHGKGGVNPPILYGENANGNIHTEETVRKICQSLQESYSMMDIMRQFGFKQYKDNLKFYGVIYDIKRGKTWKHIAKDYSWN